MSVTKNEKKSKVITIYIIIHNNKIMNERGILRCRACSIRQALPDVPESLTETIWAFPFFSYTSQQEMGEAFGSFVQPSNPSFYSTHNEEGYTFTQWQIYYLSKNRHDCKPLHRSVLHLFRVLSTYPFFRDMIRLGSVRDPAHHTLHHFTRYMDRVSYLQNEMVTLLKDNGLSLEDEDSEGMTPQDYLSNICLHPKDLRRANELTRLYKERERFLFETVCVRRCESRGPANARTRAAHFVFAHTKTQASRPLEIHIIVRKPAHGMRGGGVCAC